jgi:acyl dehydratase
MDVELAHPPATRALYRKALRGSVRRREEDPDPRLPDTRLLLRGVEADIERLSAYDHVCGFRLADALPVTYPHVLAFPLAMELMSAPVFPFPVIGLVHIGNRITQARPIRVGERLDFAVRTESLRPHTRGRQFDVVATATVDGVEVWHGVSTYLRRDKAAEPRRHGGAPTDGGGDDAVADGASRSVEDSPPTAIWRVGADIGRAYAAVSGDRNPIHLSRIGARAFGFTRPIAHGMWTMAHSVAALEGKLGETYTVDVAFRRPLPLPSTVAWRARRDSEGWTIAVGDPASGRPHLTGSVAPA